MKSGEFGANCMKKNQKKAEKKLDLEIEEKPSMGTMVRLSTALNEDFRFVCSKKKVFPRDQMEEIISEWLERATKELGIVLPGCSDTYDVQYSR